MLAKAIDADAKLLHDIGLGALLHDAGHMELPARLLTKSGPLTKAEHEIFEQHCAHGVELTSKMQLTEGALRIIEQHHECVDGSGYPHQLKGEQITLGARIVSIANAYDELCNPADIATALTPSETLAQMFALKRAKFDDRLLQLFIKRLGVYPPGSLVQLSNELLGLVVAVNPAHPLRPNILVYDPNIPKDDALIVSLLHETDLKVVKNLRPAQLPRHVHQYLNPRKNVTYYFDPAQRAPGP
jgi:HD-GYP domain-containing protein (c-di-GMP phosphodiesterase class II)